MDALLLQEKNKYDYLWNNVPSYRSVSPGELAARYFLSYFDAQFKPGDTVIDFGCGTGRAARLFLEKGLNVTLVDFSPNCLDGEIKLLLSLFPERIQFIESNLWNLSPLVKEASWIYCCDVLEHIPEEKVETVLSAMASSHVKGGYFSISLEQDLYGMQHLDQHLHLCLQSKSWWMNKISSYWNIVCEFASPLPEDNTNFHCCIEKK